MQNQYFFLGKKTVQALSPVKEISLILMLYLLQLAMRCGLQTVRSRPCFFFLKNFTVLIFTQGCEIQKHRTGLVSRKKNVKNVYRPYLISRAIVKSRNTVQALSPVKEIRKNCTGLCLYKISTSI